MKINLESIPEITLEEFAEKHSLEMRVSERRVPEGSPERYYAKFEDSEIREGFGLLAGVYGNGATPEEAIKDYAPRISLKLLIIDAMGGNRREIQVPRLK